MTPRTDASVEVPEAEWLQRFTDAQEADRAELFGSADRFLREAWRVRGDHYTLPLRTGKTDHFS